MESIKRFEKTGQTRRDGGLFRKGLNTLLIMGVGLLLMGGFAAPGEAKILYVKEDGTGDGSGGWESASNNLGTVLKNAVEGDQIWVARGTYEPTLDADYNAPGSVELATFALKNGISLYGGFAGGETALEQRDIEANPTTLTGENVSSYPKRNSYHVVTANYSPGGTFSAPTRLDGFIITGGNADGVSPHNMGGGMYTRKTGEHLTVTNCTFTKNAAEYGGGMCNSWVSNPTITNCTFSRNAARRGGGMHNDTNNSPTVTNCVFSRNSATSFGGGMNNDQSSPSITDCTFSENNADGGGGVYSYQRTPTMINCTFSQNSATNNGGGIGHYTCSSTITNCTFSENTANNGGGMYNYDQSSPTVTNCTFSKNSATVQGRGMHNSHVSNPIVTNCIFWGSSGFDIYDSCGATPVVSYCVVESGYAGGTEILTGDPELKDLADNGGPTQTCLLGENSSARNAGTDTKMVGGTNVVPATDQRGRTRPEGSGIDMGAVEMGSCLIQASAGTGGSISPSGEVIVSSGASQSFTLTSDSGYEIADLKVDGTSQGALSSYTFTNITEDHTIAGEFREPTPSPEPSVSPGPAPTTSPEPSISPDPAPTASPEPSVTSAPAPTTSPEPSISPAPTAAPLPSTSPAPTATPAPQGPITYEPWTGPGQNLLSLVPGTSEEDLAAKLQDPQSPEYQELLEKLRKLLALKGLTLNPENFHLATERLYSLESTEDPLQALLQIDSPASEEEEQYLFFVLVRTYDTESSSRNFLGYEPILLSRLSEEASSLTAAEGNSLYGYTVHDGTPPDEFPQEGHIRSTYLEAWGKGTISIISPSPPPSGGGGGGCALGVMPPLFFLLLPLALLLRK